MRLADAWIHGLRRFGGKAPHRVRIDTKLVCLIGANEAGKSTVLDGLEIGLSDAPVAPSNRARLEAVPDDRVVVRLRYRLDEGDCNALAGIDCEGGNPCAIRWFEVHRRANGTPRFVLDPVLRRDRAPRRNVLSRIQTEATRWWPRPTSPEATVDTDEAPPDRERVERLTKALAADVPDLASGTVADLRELADEVESQNETLAGDLRQCADDEAADNPRDAAIAILTARIPAFVRFDDEARLLESEYDLNQAVASPTAAFNNFASLAGLNIGELQSAIGRGETGTVWDIRERANRVLERRFESWQQEPPVRVLLETESTLLRIHVQSGTGPTMPLRERSDGLRQFVALVALTAQEHRPFPPILLIDEIETHLHYDAQADLMQVLAAQNAVTQIIYTTHSAACLPEDLGLGVRVVEGLADRTASTVRQNFWQDAHPGIGALLMAIGASSLAYVPLRPSVIAEGGADLVLLPSLMREAIGADHLDFAVVPGSSSSPPERIAGLDLQGVRTVWVLDADDGGRTRLAQLSEAGIPVERVLMLSDESDLEIEDVVSIDAYCQAVGGYVSDIGGTGPDFTPVDVPAGPCQRHRAVVAWCEARSLHPPGKVAIANKVVELAGTIPLVESARADGLRNLHHRITTLLSAP